MNRHIKLAIIVAPFLAIGGYIATDYYDKYQVNKKRYHTITVQGTCEIDTGPCLLKGAGLTLEYTIKGDVTNIESSYPLGSAAIGTRNNKEEKPYNLTPQSDKKNWTINTTKYKAATNNQNDAIRLVVKAKGHTFFSEFENTQ